MQACGTGVGQKTGSGLCNPNKEIFKILLNVFFFNNFKGLLFCYHYFGFRRSIDALGSENQPGSGSGSMAYRGRLTSKVGKHKGGF